MKRRGNTFLENVRRAQEAKSEPSEATASKDPSQMSEVELDAEIKRLDRELRGTQEAAVRVGREELAGRGNRPGNLAFGTIFKRNRRYWK